MHDYQIDPREMEDIYPVSCHPTLQNWIGISIARSREDAILEEQGIDEGTKIFMDGSGQDGHAGAVAVI